MSTKEIDEFGIDWDYEAERSVKGCPAGFTDVKFFDYFKDLVKEKGDDLVVLEMGCNVGAWYPTWRILASDLHIGITYIGIDFSLRAIELARERYKNVSFLYMNARDMAFNSEIDIIFTHTMLQHVSLGTKNVLAPKMWKALKKDGLLIIQENTATISAGTWPNPKGWIDFFEAHKFKHIMTHDIGNGGSGIVFSKVI